MDQSAYSNVTGKWMPTSSWGTGERVFQLLRPDNFDLGSKSGDSNATNSSGSTFNSDEVHTSCATVMEYEDSLNSEGLFYPSDQPITDQKLSLNEQMDESNNQSSPLGFNGYSPSTKIIEDSMNDTSESLNFSQIQKSTAHVPINLQLGFEEFLSEGFSVEVEENGIRSPANITISSDENEDIHSENEEMADVGVFKLGCLLSRSYPPSPSDTDLGLSLLTFEKLEIEEKGIQSPDSVSGFCEYDNWTDKRMEDVDVVMGTGSRAEIAGMSVVQPKSSLVPIAPDLPLSSNGVGIQSWNQEANYYSSDSYYCQGQCQPSNAGQETIDPMIDSDMGICQWMDCRGECFKTSSDLQTHTSREQIFSGDRGTVDCLWDSCTAHVTQENLIRHVVHEHFSTEYVFPRHTRCLWGSCSENVPQEGFMCHLKNHCDLWMEFGPFYSSLKQDTEAFRNSELTNLCPMSE